MLFFSLFVAESGCLEFVVNRLSDCSIETLPYQVTMETTGTDIGGSSFDFRAFGHTRRMLQVHLNVALHWNMLQLHVAEMLCKLILLVFFANTMQVLSSLEDDFAPLVAGD